MEFRERFRPLLSTVRTAAQRTRTESRRMPDIASFDASGKEMSANLYQEYLETLRQIPCACRRTRRQAQGICRVSHVVQYGKRVAAQDLLFLRLRDRQRLDRADGLLDRAQKMRVIAAHQHV